MRNATAGILIGGLLGLAISTGLSLPKAEAQRTSEEATYEYKVGIYSYNPGERLTDEQRAAFYERTLNEQSRQGWEAIGTVLSRDVSQTVGGGVTTRDTTSFVAYRRRKK